MAERDEKQAIYNAGQQEAKHSEILPLKGQLEFTNDVVVWLHVCTRMVVQYTGHICLHKHVSSDRRCIYPLDVYISHKIFEANQLITETLLYQSCSNHHILFNKFNIGAAYSAYSPNSH